MPPCHDPSNEVPLPGVEPSRPLLMTFSAQRYTPQVRPPPAVHISLSRHNDAQEDTCIEVGSVWSLALGPHSLISSTDASINTDIGYHLERNSWAQKLTVTREKAARYSYVMNRRLLAGISLVWTGISRWLRGCKMRQNAPK